MSKSVIRQIIELQSKSATDMRQIYNEIMPKKCPANAHKEYLRPRIAHRLQELAFGSLTEESRNKLLKISEGISVKAVRHYSEMMPGTKICREWQGVMHEVEVRKDYYEYQGHKFKSLSSIARKITNTRWNGLKFFKIKS
jgi:hypothetical protein